MNINLTLIGQSITFALFLWFCMRFIWPPIMNALETRRIKIADGLAAGERGHHAQELSRQRAVEHIKEAKGEASDIILQAQKRASEIIDEAKGDARIEAERIVIGANAEIEQETNRAREQLRQEVVALAIVGAEKVLQREVDKKVHASVLNKLVTQL